MSRLKAIVFAVFASLWGLAGGGDETAAQLLPEPPQNPHVKSPREQPAAERTEQLLDRLFARLHRAEDQASADLIIQAIWQLWMRSPSPTGNALMTQARRAMAGQNYTAALAILDTLVELRPDFVEARNKRATVYFLLGRYADSEADIAAVLKAEPRHFGALSGLGMIRREKGDKKGALKAFRRALAVNPFARGAKQAVKELASELEQDI